MEFNMRFIKRIFGASACVAGVLSTASCELDNYPGPDAQIYGEVRDAETGELIQQDLSGGSIIRYIEHGYENPDQQSMNFKVDGTYRNNMMFSGTYDFYFEESNFQIQERLTDYKIKKGENRLDFEVIPYIRITDVSITRNGDKIVASFKVTPTVDNNVRQIGLFGHPDFIVGNQYALDRVTRDINESFNGQTREYTLELGTGAFSSGEPCYFRVGAIIDVANSKYNYAPAVTIDL